MKRTLELDRYGWSELGRDSFNRFTKDRNDISNTYKIGKLIYVYFTDDDEVGRMDIVTGYWGWTNRDTARHERYDRRE